MKSNNVALRLPDSLYINVKQAALADGVAMNQYIAIAVAEKLACRQTAASFLAGKAKGGSAARALKILAKAGRDVDESEVSK